MPTLVTVTLNPDGSCTVTDNGRGIPTEMHPTEGVSATEVIMTQLHAGGKFDQNSYKVSGGLHGVGVSVVNALSVWLKLKIRRKGGIFEMSFTHGVADAPLRQTGDAGYETGTEITFLPSTETFTMVEFDYGTLEHRLRELAFLNSGVRIVLTDAAMPTSRRRNCMLRGRAGRVRQISRPRQEAADLRADRHPRRARRHHGRGRHVVERQLPRECAGLHQQHPAARRRHASGRLPRRADPPGDWLCRDFRHRQEGEGGTITGDDCREGLTAVLSVKVPDPKFSSQTKDKLVSSEVRPVVESLVNEALGTWLEEHPAEGKVLDRQGRRGRRCARGRAQGAR